MSLSTFANAKTTTSICTDTTQPSCVMTQKIHDQMNEKNAQATEDGRFAPVIAEGTPTAIVGGVTIQGFTNPTLLDISWIGLYVAGTLILIYGLVK
jgi:hypothetical protein